MPTVRMHQELAVPPDKLHAPALRHLPERGAVPFGEPSIAYRLANVFSGWSQPAANASAAPATNVVEVRMLKTRMKRLADRGDRAVQRLAEIEASITNLSNEDLLDLADIFKAGPRPPIGEMAFSEMARRDISL
jgi:hypothetical protein